MQKLRFVGGAALLVCSASSPVAARAAGAPPAPPGAAADAEIIVYGRAIDRIGVATSGSEGVVGYKDFEDRPLSRVGELVENVPGLIATQHSGSGKANQYFLRGFNLDHGTDLAGFVDGVPINMRSHGHGHGYLDLNFLIPELVERIDYRKGPYYADVGDFSAAGTIKFATADTLPAPIVQAEIGMFDYYRGLTAGSFKLGHGDLLLGLDGTLSNGVWDLDERLRKINGVVKYSQGTRDHGFSIEAWGYRSTWHSTDQVPQRAIQSGLIGRYGNIDSDLGGETTRLSLSGQGRFGNTEVSAFGLYYKFRLTSNFTYFLDDPVHGDEFQQRDERGVFGGSIKHSVPATLFGRPVTFVIGADTRYDRISPVALYQSEFGNVIRTRRKDYVDEYGGGIYGEARLAVTDRLRAVIGARGDFLGYDVRANNPLNSGRGDAAIGSPKVSLAWKAADHFELYANYGQSHHSNDVRGATITVDPGDLTPVGRVPALVRAQGYEGGVRVEYARFNASLVGFFLDLDSELVFAGDSGTNEPQGATRRYGGEFNAFWRPLNGIVIDGQAAITHARFSDAPGMDRIPNSVGFVASGGVRYDVTRRLTADVRVRHFGPAPLIEDNSARSHATTLVNAGLYSTIGHAKLALDVLNLFDSTDNDIAYFYTSRLANEPADGVDDYHLHPVEKRQLRASVRDSF